MPHPARFPPEGDHHQRGAVGFSVARINLPGVENRALGSHQGGRPFGPGRHVQGDAAALPDADQRPLVGTPLAVQGLDVVQGVARHGGHGLLNPDHIRDVLAHQPLQREAEFLEEIEDHPPVEQLLPARSDRHGLGLVTDRIDRPGQLVDGVAERDVEQIDGRGRLPLPRKILPEIVQRQLAQGVLQKQDEVGDGPDAQEGKRSGPAALLKTGREGAHHLAIRPIRHHLEEGLPLPPALRHLPVQPAPELTEEQGVRVDPAGGEVAPQVAGDGIQDDRQRPRGPRNGDDGVRRVVEAVVPLVAEDDHGGLMGLEDGHILDDIAHDRFRTPRRADEDQRLRRQVDVLFVLHNVGRDGLVAQLAQLDPDLVGGGLVGTAADHRPRGFPDRQPIDGRPDLVLSFEDPPHHLRRPLQDGQFAVDGGVGQRAQKLGQAEGQDAARDNLGIKGLGRGHGHLDVPAVARVENAVGLRGDVRLTTVDDGDDGRPPLPRQGHGAVGVRRRPRLGDGDHECGCELILQRKPAQLRGQPGFDDDPASLQIAREGIRDGLAGHGRRAVADHHDPVELSPFEAPAERLRENIHAQVETHLRPRLRIRGAAVFPQEGFPDRQNGLFDLLEEIVGVGPPVDVPGGDLRPLKIVFRQGKGRSVITKGPEAGQSARRFPVEDDDLSRRHRRPTAAGWRLSLHLEKGGGPLHQTVQFRREQVAVGGEADIEGLAAAAQGEENLSRRAVGGHGDGVRPFEARDGAAKGLGQIVPRPQISLDLEGDDFRIGSHFRGNGLSPRLQRVPQRGVVVDVAVQDDADRPDGPPRTGTGSFRPGVGTRRGEVVDRMAVLDGNGPDGRPARMRHGKLRRARVTDDELKDLVPGDCLTEVPNVPPQFPDDRGRLEREGNGPARLACGIRVPVGRKHGDGTRDKISRRRPLSERLVEVPRLQLPPNSAPVLRIGQGKGDLYPRRIPSAHLQAVETVQEEVQVVELAKRGHVDVAARTGQGRDPTDILQDVLFQGPHRILEGNQPAVDDLQGLRPEPSGGILQQALLIGQERLQIRDQPAQSVDTIRIKKKRLKEACFLQAPDQRLQTGRALTIGSAIARLRRQIFPRAHTSFENRFKPVALQLERDPRQARQDVPAGGSSIVLQRLVRTNRQDAGKTAEKNPVENGEEDDGGGGNALGISSDINTPRLEPTNDTGDQRESLCPFISGRFAEHGRQRIFGSSKARHVPLAAANPP